MRRALLPLLLGGCGGPPPDGTVTGTITRFDRPWAVAEVARRGAEVTWTLRYAGVPPSVVTARLDPDGALASWRSAAGGTEQTSLRRTAGGYAWRTRLLDGTDAEGTFDVPALAWPPAGAPAAGRPLWTGAAVVADDPGFRAVLDRDGLPVAVSWPDRSRFEPGPAPDVPLVTPDDLAWPADAPLPHPRQLRVLEVDAGGHRLQVEAPLEAELPRTASPPSPPPPHALPGAVPLPGLPPADHLRDLLRAAHALAWRQLGEDADCKALAARTAGLLLGAGVDAEPVHGLVFTEAPTPAFRPHAWVRVRVGGDGWLATDPALHELVADASHVDVAPDTLAPGERVHVHDATWTDGARLPRR